MCPPGSTHPPPPRLGDLRGPSFPRSPAAFSGSRRKVGFRLFPLSRRSADCQVLAAATAPQLRRDSGRGTRGLHGAPTDARAAPRSRPRPAAAPGPRRARHTGRRQDTQPCAWRQILLPLDSNLPYLSKRGAAPCPAPHPSPRCAPRGSEARLGRAGPRGGIHRATPPPCASARAAFVRTFPVAVRTMGSFHL